MISIWIILILIHLFKVRFLMIFASFLNSFFPFIINYFISSSLTKNPIVFSYLGFFIYFGILLNPTAYLLLDLMDLCLRITFFLSHLNFFHLLQFKTHLGIDIRQSNFESCVSLPLIFYIFCVVISWNVSKISFRLWY